MEYRDSWIVLAVSIVPAVPTVSAVSAALTILIVSAVSAVRVPSSVVQWVMHDLCDPRMDGYGRVGLVPGARRCPPADPSAHAGPYAGPPAQSEGNQRW